MDKRIVRRFGRPKKNLKYTWPRDKDGFLTYRSYNGCWTISVQMLVTPEHKVVKPWGGRVVDNRTGKQHSWIKLGNGRVLIDNNSTLPVYVKHAVHRIAEIGCSEIGRRTQRKLIAVRRATL